MVTVSAKEPDPATTAYPLPPPWITQSGGAGFNTGQAGQPAKERTAYLVPARRGTQVELRPVAAQ